MKNLFLISFLVAGKANALTNPDDFGFMLQGCEDQYKKCEIIDMGNVDQLVWAQSRERSIDKRSPAIKDLNKALAMATDMDFNSVDLMILGLKNSTLEAGFTSFKSELSGERSKISFQMDMKTNQWSINSMISSTVRDDLTIKKRS